MSQPGLLSRNTSQARRSLNRGAERDLTYARQTEIDGNILTDSTNE
jgi:hypothetical protein